MKVSGLTISYVANILVKLCNNYEGVLAWLTSFISENLHFLINQTPMQNNNQFMQSINTQNIFTTSSAEKKVEVLLFLLCIIQPPYNTRKDLVYIH